MDETTEMKEKNEILRKEIKEKIREARKSVAESRTERSQLVNA